MPKLSVVNKKKIRLDYNEAPDFFILGISSFEKDYRLIWSLNNAMGFQFARTDDHQAFNKKVNAEIGFPSYIFRDDDRYIQYRFIANKSEDGILLDELKNIDFILLIQGEVDQNFIDAFRKNLTGIENVQAVFRITPGQLKNVQRLFFQ